MALNYDAIMSVEDVQKELRDSVPGLDFSDATDLLFIETIIGEVTRSIESILDRNIIVIQHRQYTQYSHWRYDNARGSYWVYADAMPIVEIDTAGFSSGKSNASRLNDIITYSSGFSGAITYYSGWKRPEQTLSDLNAELPDLGTLPSNVPEDIRSVAIQGIMHRISERNHGPGMRSRTISPAVQTVTINSPMMNFLEDAVNRRLVRYKALR